MTTLQERFRQLDPGEAEPLHREPARQRDETLRSEAD
jgi:hypothetical protein